MNATLMNEVHQSKWGYHSASRETFLKLKEAHGLLLRAYQDAKRHNRWVGKDPQNRRGEEPEYVESMTEYGHHTLDKRSFYGHGFRRCRDKNGMYQNYYLHILREYRKVRVPVATPEEVVPLDLPDDFERIIDYLRDYYK